MADRDERESRKADIKARARDYYEDYQVLAALNLWQEVVRIDPTDAFSWYRVGTCLRIIGRTSDARRTLLKALRLCPERTGQMAGELAVLYMDAGRCRRADRWFARAVADEEMADLPWLWIMRGANLARRERFADAERCYLKAISFGTGDLDEAYLNLGLVQRAMGRYEDAAESAATALSYTPDYEDALELQQTLQGLTEAKTFLASL